MKKHKEDEENVWRTPLVEAYIIRYDLRLRTILAPVALLLLFLSLPPTPLAELGSPGGYPRGV